MSADGVFTTSPAGARDFSFVVMGDIGDNANFRTNVANIDAGSPFPGFFVSTGDNMYSDGTNQAGWDSWFAAWEPLTLKGLALMPSLGNHDVSSGGTAYHKGQFSLPGNEEWYSFCFADACFVALNMNTAYGSGSQQYRDVEAMIQQARASGAKWIIPFFHQPGYSSGSHGSDMGIRNAYEPMFDRYGIDVVLQGHDHNYQRSYAMNGSQVVDQAKGVYEDPNGRIWIVTGGGGRSLYDPGSMQSWQVTSAQTYHYTHISIFANGSLHSKAVDLTKRVIDEFWIVKTGGGGQNNAPQVPTISGPGAGPANASLSFDFQGSDPDADQVKYTVDWGDGNSDTSGLVNSGTKQTIPHSWAAPGAYQVKAMSIDAKGAASAWSAASTVTITPAGGQNSAPAAPSLSGPQSVDVGVPGSFEALATDPDGDRIAYEIDWGDGTGDTGQLVDSGAKSTFQHAWAAKGTFSVKARATDSRGLGSAWGATLRVEVKEPRQPDKEPPVVEHSPVARAPAGSAIAVAARITDNDFVHHAELRWRPGGGSWQVAVMFSEPQGRYAAEIPAADVRGATLHYYIVGFDDTFNNASSPPAGAAAPHEVLIEGGARGAGGGGNPFGLPAGISVPLLAALAATLVALAAVGIALRRRRRRAAGAPPVAGAEQGQWWDEGRQGRPPW
jgi:hypothetical protein